VTRDTVPPVVRISSPSDGFLTRETSIALAWSIGRRDQTADLLEELPVEGVNTIARSVGTPAANFGKAVSM